MGALDGTVALVTGGGSGLGRSVVDGFIAEGARVGVLDRDKKKLDDIALQHGDKVVAIPGDVREFETHQRAVATVTAAFGQLDALVGTAAIMDYAKGFDQIPVDRLDQTFDEIMAVNVKGYLYAAIAAAPELSKTKGSVTLTLSTSGLYPGLSGPMYTLSKHAGIGLVRELAFELAPRVRVNGVVPGGVSSSDLRGPEALGQESRTLRRVPRNDLVAAMTPLARMPEDDEYPPIYVLLASQASRIATGSIFCWDGGLSSVGHGMSGS